MSIRSAIDTAVFGGPDAAVEFIANVLESSTEYSIIAADLDGTIVLWNEGARRIYGFEPDEVVGRLNLADLYSPAGREAGEPAATLAGAQAEGKWEGTVKRARKSGECFMARVVVTPRRDDHGDVMGYLLISKNISEEIRLTDELKDTQFYTRSLIESNVDALMTTDPLGIITDVNQQMETLTGYSRDELIGSPFKQYFTEPGRAEAAIKQVVQDGKVTNYELTARHRGSRETVVSYNASTFRDASGRLQGVFAAARDITEQKNLERQLRDSEAYNRGLIEASVDGLVTVDLQGLVSDVNEQMCRMSGLPREDLIGTPFADHFADADNAVAGVQKTLEQGVVTDYVLRLAAAGERQLQVSFNASVFRDPAGEVRGIFASARDITEQAQLQRQIIEERAYNRGLIEASLDGLVTVDAILVITDVNETMCAMSGYARAELIGTSFPDYFTDPRRAAAGVRLTLDQGAVTNYELTLRAKDGVERLVSFNAAIFKDEEGDVRGIFASARDITEQARLQHQLDEERAYNRGLIETSVDGLITVDESMTITDVNETMCRMVGRQRTALIGSSFPAYFTEPQRAEQGVRLTFAEGSTRDYVLTLVVVDGSSLPVSFNAAVFRDSTGETRGIFASARDISNQQQLEQQLRDSQFYTRSLIESNVDALMTTDPLGVITDVNQQMEALTGCRRDELIGVPFKSFFTEPQRAEEGIRRTLSVGKVTNYELTARGGDGRETVVSYNAATFLNQRGELQGVFAAARDVTENKRLEEKLRDQTGYLRGLIESSVDGLVAVDSEGYISDVNEQLCRMSGYQRSELLGSPFANYFTDPARARAGIEETFQLGAVTEYALTLISRTRRLLQVSFNASVFTEPSGTVRGIFASARDITDRLRLEEQLREQQTYLRGLIESSVDGLVTVDPEGYITDVNEQMCRMAEYPREELVGSPFKYYFTEPELADLGVKRTFAAGVVTNYELVLQTKNKRKSTVSFNASVYRSADGRVEGIFASARDISEQARLQQQLGDQQVYNRSLVEASADALFAIAPDGIITDVNEEATRLTGYSRHHLVNSTFSSYFVEASRARDGVEKTLAEDKVLGSELTLLTRYGRQVPVSLNAGVFRDTTGTPLGILAAARNVTSQRELEQQLRDSQFYTRSLIESNVDALMTTDSLGIITDVNQQMEVLTGFRREELIGAAFKQFFTDPVLAEEAIRTALREEKVTDYELTARHRAGNETVVSYNATTFYDRDGRLQGVFAAARDVTERKRFEQQLWEKNVELEKASKAKDNFLASMSHELRTPLNAIIGFTGTLLMGLAGPLNDEQERHLGTVQESGRHLLSIINDLLDLAKIESGKVQVALEPVSCSALIREVVASLRPLAAGKALSLHAHNIERDAMALADRRALSQILINLVNNAIKFTESGEVVVSLLPGADGQQHRIEVTDTGPGIPESDHERIFHAFQRTDRTIRRGDEGTGLGLHISVKLAELLGATISVRSSPGCGSTFTIAIGGRR
jgi:PAS domain S-box-containing protein